MVEFSPDPRRSRAAADADIAVGELEECFREFGGEMGLDMEVPAKAHSRRLVGSTSGSGSEKAVRSFEGLKMRMST